MTAIMDEEQVAQAIKKISKAICNDLQDPNRLFIVGIHTGGVHLARRVQKEIALLQGVEAPCGMLDITLYRDDLFGGFTKPIVGATVLPHSIEKCEVVLVDDVLYTGRTVRSALIELMDYGRPKRIRLAVLIDRGHRELPIMADYIGYQVETTSEETVRVNLKESASRDEVLLLRRRA